MHKNMSASKKLSNMFFYPPIIFSLFTFILVVWWGLYSGPAPDTIKQDLIWLSPFIISFFYNFIALVFFSTYYTSDYVKALPSVHVLRLSAQKFMCASNLTLMLSFCLWTCLKDAAVIIEPLSKPGGIVTWFIFGLSIYLGFLVFFIVMMPIWVFTGVFEDFKVYKNSGINYSTALQAMRSRAGQEDIEHYRGLRERG